MLERQIIQYNRINLFHDTHLCLVAKICFLLHSIITELGIQLDSLIRCCYSSWLSLVTFKVNLLKVVEFC